MIGGWPGGGGTRKCARNYAGFVMLLPQVAFDVRDPEFIRDPYPLLTRLREETPIFYEPRLDKIFLTRYEDVSTVLRAR